MSIPVDLEELAAEIARYGPGAFLMSAGEDGPPHVSSVLVVMDGESLRIAVGRRTAANIATRPGVALVWTAPSDREHCLIVDGVAERESAADGVLRVSPQSAVLHRLATASDDVERCIRLEDATAPGE